MKTLILKIFRDRRGQDLVEYALLLGFAATTAGVTVPTVTNSISNIFINVQAVLAQAGGSAKTSTATPASAGS